MLSRKKRYLQVALNSTPQEGESIIDTLPPSDRILVEAGTPLIKEFGVDGIRRIKDAWEAKMYGYSPTLRQISSNSTRKLGRNETPIISSEIPDVYIVADTKCMDRGTTEVNIALKGGASAATVLGAAPLPTINYFIENCTAHGLDSMIDFIGVPEPIKILRKLRKMPSAESVFLSLRCLQLFDQKLHRDLVAGWF